MNEIDRYTAVWKYRDSLDLFFKDAWKVIEPDKELIWNWHHAYLCEQLKSILFEVIEDKPRVTDTIFNVPPGTTKSTLITIVFPVWGWVHKPSLRFLTMSYAETLAIAHAVKSRDIIQSDWFREIFDDIFTLKYDVNKKSEYANDKQGSRIAFGVGGAATGKHGDLLICDDPINPKKAASPVQLIGTNKWWDNTIANRLCTPEVSQKIVVMQRLATNDLTGHCLNKKAELYKHFCLPAEVSNKVHPPFLKEFYTEGLLDTVRLNKNVLQHMRTSLGSNEYSGQYSQNPIPEGGNLVKPEWFGWFDLTRLEKRAYDNGDTLVWDVFIDGAYTEKEINCPSALLCSCYYENNLYIRDVARVWMELPELIKFVPGFVAKNGMNGQTKVIIEPKASGMSAAQMLRKYSNLNVILDKPPRDGKTERLKAKLPFMEAERVFLLDGASWCDMLLDELKAFPNEYTDITDTLVMSIDRIEGKGSGGSILGMGVTG